MVTLSLIERTSSFGLMISIVFCFGSSIDVAGAKTSFSAFCIGSDIGVGTVSYTHLTLPTKA